MICFHEFCPPSQGTFKYSPSYMTWEIKMGVWASLLGEWGDILGQEGFYRFCCIYRKLLALLS